SRRTILAAAEFLMDSVAGASGWFARDDFGDSRIRRSGSAWHALPPPLYCLMVDSIIGLRERGRAQGRSLTPACLPPARRGRFLPRFSVQYSCSIDEVSDEDASVAWLRGVLVRADSAFLGGRLAAVAGSRAHRHQQGDRAAQVVAGGRPQVVVEIRRCRHWLFRPGHRRG